MNEKIATNLLKIAAKLRNHGSRLILPKSSEWDKYRNLSMDGFSKVLEDFEYKSDPLHGSLDYVATFEHFINPTIKYGRDCDDFARMWTLWGIYNGYTAYEFIVSTKDNIYKMAHLVTVLSKDNKYWLCNYKNYPYTYDLLTALNKVKIWNRYKNGYIYTLQHKYNSLSK